jgi:hypothetical protein
MHTHLHLPSKHASTHPPIHARKIWPAKVGSKSGQRDQLRVHDMYLDTATTWSRIATHHPSRL